MKTTDANNGSGHAFTFANNAGSKKGSSNGINIRLSTESPQNMLNSVESLPDGKSLGFDTKKPDNRDNGSGNPEFFVKEISSQDRIDDHYKNSILSDSKRA